MLLLLPTGCAVNPVTGNRDFVLMTEQQEIALGRKMHAQILKEMPRYADVRLAQRVQRVGERLARNSHRSNLVYRFTVVDSTQVNAFALPGGYIYITRGILAYLNSEAELAAVLAHEIGHVTARHAVQRQSAATAAGIIGAIINAKVGVRGINQLTQLLGGALLSGYGRSQELESDRLGAAYLARSGYDPQAMLGVIRLLKNQALYAKKVSGTDKGSYHGLFATHPDNDTRLQAVIAAANSLRTDRQGQVGRDSYLQWIDGLMFGDSEAQGIRRGNRFYHQGLDLVLTFPQGWRLINKPQHVLARSVDGKGVVQFSMQDINRRISPRQFMQDRLGLKPLFNGRVYRIRGRSAYTAMAWSNSPFGRRLVRFVVVFRKDQAMIFSAVNSDSNNARRYDKALFALAESLRGLKQSERKLAKAQRIGLIRATRNTRFRQLARQSSLSDRAEDQLRLINGRYPKGEPRVGEWLKIIR
ncbi:MAG: M48 family metalloprotease [Gammaproteobacteria bacterium]|nr:M48 family metalloprotease [Gammaproteobacteria bacterium]